MQSVAHALSPVAFPQFTGLQVYMLQATAGTLADVAPEGYRDLVSNMLKDGNIPADTQVWLTVDESNVKAGKKQRRGGAHIDGNYDLFASDWCTGSSGWLNGVPGRELTLEEHHRSYQEFGGGMLIASNHAACQVWEGEVNGIPGQGGDCEHLRDQLEMLPTYLMESNRAYLTNSQCVHESLPLKVDFPRQLVRITLSEQYKFN
ncbi:hypothetical protein PARSHIK_128 [Erwinia phage vB_EamM_Parshik]|nr:hypothetical protein PARSHIK_128 [Erwinia phage vB_EamM_Parshik]